jgi:hypothetical protein
VATPLTHKARRTFPKATNSYCKSVSMKTPVSLSATWEITSSSTTPTKMTGVSMQIAAN